MEWYGGDMGNIWGEYGGDMGEEKWIAKTHGREKFRKSKKAADEMAAVW